jgi:hypothetical protein
MFLICAGVVARTRSGDVRPVYELALFATGVSAGVLLTALVRRRLQN